MINYFSDRELERYSRHILLPEVGALGQSNLKNASVLVVGMGGLGAPLVQQLASSGVGHLGLVDHDRIELSNLQRQILYQEADIGRYKAEVAAEKAELLNPFITATPMVIKADQNNLDQIIPTYDIVCDGSDNFTTRLTVSDACVKHGKTLVSGAVQGFSGQIGVFRPHKGGPCYRCLFPEANETDALTCGQSGVLGPAAGVMGSLMAVETTIEIMQLRDTAETFFTVWDALTSTFRTLKVSRDPACPMHVE
ncbi:HesA/MoeB/ThiF family protein [Swingsia samuiensis]|uniref:Molybdopterin-synthase adenylyltransferase n=1 Tax=Swingsia samuiensis TaxID=1293412 RepID=A0A4Y6UP15_9PROT|nr:HesA/MoeB/ThiF family protein [Swingsia samuiensis]QDH17795.1 HesA/MoeB/ThiF family protein [Swingsia samuiensis]